MKIVLIVLLVKVILIVASFTVFMTIGRVSRVLTFEEHEPQVNYPAYPPEYKETEKWKRQLRPERFMTANDLDFVCDVFPLKKGDKDYTWTTPDKTFRVIRLQHTPERAEHSCVGNFEFEAGRLERSYK